MKANLGKRVHGDPPIGVVLLDRFVDDGGWIIGNASFSEERVERAEVGRDEIVGALRGHRHKRSGASLRGRQIFCDQGFQRIGALGRRRLVGGERGKPPQKRRGQRQRRKATARSARAKSGGGHGAACSVQRGQSEFTPSLFQIRRRRATISARSDRLGETSLTARHAPAPARPGDFLALAPWRPRP